MDIMTATLTLFDDPPAGPPGFLIRGDLIDAAEERALMRRFADLPFAPFDFRGFKGNRRTVAFGSRYDFTHGRVAPADAIPVWLLPLRDRAAAFAGLAPRDLVQALVIDYPPGAGIGWHRDRPDYGEIVGVSFGAPAVLRLRRKTAAGWERRTAPLEPRSAYHLTGQVRDDWEHSIVPGETQRYSVTFRTLR